MLISHTKGSLHIDNADHPSLAVFCLCTIEPDWIRGTDCNGEGVLRSGKESVNWPLSRINWLKGFYILHFQPQERILRRNRPLEEHRELQTLLGQQSGSMESVH